MTRVLVCGSRDWTDKDAIYRAIRSVPGVSAILHGGARGADRIAGEYARDHGILEEVYPADWTHLGRSAGPIRNQHMLEHGHPDLVLAFPTPYGKGTWDMMFRAHRAGVRVQAYGDGQMWNIR